MGTEHRSDYVRDSKLLATFTSSETRHVYYTKYPSSDRRRRRVRQEERWLRGRELGSGAFGRVWLESRVPVLEDPVPEIQLRAVKEVNKKLNGDVSVDYTRELEAAAKFSQEKYADCFVKLFGWFETETTILIAMEYMELGDLRQYMNQGPFEEVEAQAIAWQLAEGLEFMHEAGFTHRDLKPANIFVKSERPDWWVKIGDFGICKCAEAAATALRTVIGTPGYMAPEVLGFVHAEEELSEDSADKTIPFSYTQVVDVWALGEIVFRLRTQAPAFSSLADLGRYAIQQRMGWIQPLRDRGASDDCCDFVVRAMAADPRQRMTAAEASVHAWVRNSESLGRSNLSLPLDVSNNASPLSTFQQEIRLLNAQEAPHEHDLCALELEIWNTNEELPDDYDTEEAQETTSRITLMEAKRQHLSKPQRDSQAASHTADSTTSQIVRDVYEDTTADQSTGPTLRISPTILKHVGRDAGTVHHPPRDTPDLPTEDFDQDATADWSTASHPPQESPFSGRSRIENDSNGAALTWWKEDGREIRHNYGPPQETYPTSTVHSLYDRGKGGTTEQVLRKAAERQERLLGKDNMDTLKFICELGRLLYEQGKYSDAEREFRKVAEGQERLLGQYNKDTLQSIHELGRLLYKQGKYSDAERELLKVAEGYERLLGKDNEDTLQSIHELGRLLYKQGKYSDAERELLKAAKGYERLLGKDNEDTLRSIHELGLSLYNQRKYDIAEPELWKAAEGRERLLGKDNEDTLQSIHELGLSLYKQGKYTIAEQELWKAAEGRKRLLGKDNKDTLQSIHWHRKSLNHCWIKYL